jgi:tryptophan-rich sensory protein
VVPLLVWLIVCLGAGFFGSQFGPGDWYASLAKPAFNPPNSVFAPVWTALYILMAVAAWLVWMRAGYPGRNAAVILFIVQIVLNGFWSYLFFGLHRPDIAFFEIIVLWLAILLTLLLFWRIRALAGMLLIPYLLWVSFASVLNYYLWRLNV